MNISILQCCNYSVPSTVARGYFMMISDGWIHLSPSSSLKAVDAPSVCSETFFRKKLVFTFHPFRVWYANMNDISSWFFLPAYFNDYEISMSESLVSEVIFLGIISVGYQLFHLYHNWIMVQVLLLWCFLLSFWFRFCFFK